MKPLTATLSAASPYSDQLPWKIKVLIIAGLVDKAESSIPEFVLNDDAEVESQYTLTLTGRPEC